MATRKRTREEAAVEDDPDTIRLMARLTEQLGEQYLARGNRVKAAKAFEAARALRAMVKGGGGGGSSNDPNARRRRR